VFWIALDLVKFQAMKILFVRFRTNCIELDLESSVLKRSKQCLHQIYLR